MLEPAVEELSRAQGRALFAAACHRAGYTPTEFLARHDAGQTRDPEDMAVVMLIPFWRDVPAGT